jgi:hypothetical protein
VEPRLSRHINTMGDEMENLLPKWADAAAMICGDVTANIADPTRRDAICELVQRMAAICDRFSPLAAGRPADRATEEGRSHE